MKVIILGASGFIGRALEKELLRKRHMVLTISHEVCDIRKPLTLPPADILYHFSANSRVYFASQNPVLDFETNALGTIHVLDACLKNNIKKIVYASSLFVYKNLWDADETSETGYNENGGAYGLSKLTGDLYLEHYSRNYGIKTVNFRIASPYGPNMRKNLIYDLITGYLDKDNITLYCAPDTKTDFVYIDDVTSAMVMAANPSFEGVYNLSSGEARFTEELIEIVSSFFPAKKAVQFGEKAIKIRAKNTKLINAGWNIKTSLKDGIEKTINYFRGARNEGMDKSI